MKNHPICVAARALRIGLAALMQEAPLYWHVKGHAGDEAHELADGSANWTLLECRELRAFRLDVRMWNRGGIDAISGFHMS